MNSKVWCILKSGHFLYFKPPNDSYDLVLALLSSFDWFLDVQFFVSNARLNIPFDLSKEGLEKIAIMLAFQQ